MEYRLPLIFSKQMCEEKIMRSYRPIREWEQDRDREAFYSNRLISVLNLFIQENILLRMSVNRAGTQFRL